MPIYLVTLQTDPAQTRIVDAPTKAAAQKHVLKDLVSTAPLSASELIQHMNAGMKVEQAVSEAAAPEAPAEPEAPVEADAVGEGSGEVETPSYEGTE